MKINVTDVRIVSGQFQIEEGSPSGESSLYLSVDYVLKNKDVVVAVGKAGNTVGIPMTFQLSDLTLKKFGEFYLSVEQDLSNFLDSEAENDPRSELESILRSASKEEG